MQAKEGFHIRNYATTDLSNYEQFCLAMGLIEPVEECPSLQLLCERLSRPNYDPTKDLFVVEFAGDIVGHLDITAEIGIDRALFQCLIHPAHRRLGLASRLLEEALERLRKICITRAQFNLLADNSSGQDFVTQCGFLHIRDFLELRASIEQVRWQYLRIPPGLIYRHLQPGEEGALAQLQNQCFTGSWGFNPNTEEDIVYSTTLCNHSPADIIVAELHERLVAYCWVIRTGQKDAGRVHMLGVDPAYRGMHLGRGALLAGLAHFKRQGFRHLEVTVDSHNQTAYHLYLTAGFQIWKTSLWYQKKVCLPVCDG